jgi:hypothetical protein
VIIPNTQSVRVVEFLPNEVEVDHLIIAFDIGGFKYEPIIVGTMPTKNWCFYANPYGDDMDAKQRGKWVLPNGTTFATVGEVREYFGTITKSPVTPIKKI